MESQMQDEKLLAGLRDQRDVLLGRNKVLAAQHQQLYRSAATGDKAAQLKVNKINTEASTIGHEMVALEVQITEVDKRLDAARIAESIAIAREKAAHIVALNAQLKEELDNADDALADAIGSVLSARKLLGDLHALGVTSPTDQMFRLIVTARIKTEVQLLPPAWVNDFEFMRLLPSQKRAFKPNADVTRGKGMADIATAWHNQIANQIAHQLPKQQEV